MKRKIDIQEVRAKKRQQLIERTMLVLSLTDEKEVRKLLEIGRRQAVRVNPLKQDAGMTHDQINSLSGDMSKTSLYEHGYIMNGDIATLRDSMLQQEGFIYIQNAASWLPVLQLNPQQGDTVLDMCAAPGGKTSLIAALTENQAHITANDNSKPRLMRLQANMKRLNAEIDEYMLHDASRLATTLQGRTFDKILLDAPCSGEGMMRLSSDKDFDSWSIAHIKRLGKLQRRLIVQAWNLLEPGGTLVYSTCTMAPEENEAVVDYLLRHVDDVEIIRHEYPDSAGLYRVQPVLRWGERSYDARIADALRLAPSEAAEAFFVCHLRKTTT